MDDKQNFTTGSIPKKLVSFMLPILGALILQAMYSAVDLLIVGRFGTSGGGISGVATGSNVMNLFTFFTCNLSVGVTVLMGQYLGEGHSDRIGKLLGGAILFFIGLSVLFSLIMFIFATPIAHIVQAPEGALEQTVTYIRICAVGFVFVVFYNFISAIMRGLGDSKLPLIFVGIACLVNIAGDLILVAGFKMDVAGAAIATIAAQAVSVILSVIIIMKRKLPFDFSIKDLRFSVEVKKFVIIGSPLALQEILTNGTFLALCAFINAMGLEYSSGYGVGQKITAFAMLVPSAIMQSLASFVAQNVGARKEKRATRALVTSMGIGAFIGVFMALAVFFYGDVLGGIFTKDRVVALRAHEFLKGFAIEAVITSILFSFMGYFNAHAKSVFVMIMGIVQSVCIRLPFSYFMSIQPDRNLTKVGLAAPIATVFGIAIAYIYYVYLHRSGNIPRTDE